eukprot:GHVU01041610.1.p3 GENE.GHVU01041610.1~~GHVU01041610.1.p3  ORF type:complete len:131 (+),score=22.56 GHVU01041610.1:496-888(+)
MLYTAGGSGTTSNSTQRTKLFHLGETARVEAVKSGANFTVVVEDGGLMSTGQPMPLGGAATLMVAGNETDGDIYDSTQMTDNPCNRAIRTSAVTNVFNENPMVGERRVVESAAALFRLRRRASYATPRET